MNIITIENHSVVGGLEGAIAEELSKYSNHAPLKRIGVEDIFTESGKTLELKAKYGLCKENIVNICESLQKISVEG